MTDTQATGDQTTSETTKPSYQIKPFGENGWVAVLADSENHLEIALFANAVARNLRDKAELKDAVIDSIAGMDSVTLRFDPAHTTANDMRFMLAETLKATAFAADPSSIKSIDIPVCYGGAHGPDFDELCAHLDLTAKQLIEAHASRKYRVLALGFAPGFAYLGPLDPTLQAPRLDTPRPHVDAGAVGVAGAFTGVYPLASPGGWRIIGRTPARLFDPYAPTPFIFEAGAEVRFTPIPAADFSNHSVSAT